MSDCINVAIRDLLPERLHDLLDATELARVDSHLATCEECAAEYALLRAAQESLVATYAPRLDTAAIVAALPRPPRIPSTLAASARASSVRRNAVAWRMAAAVTVISLGGLSFAALRQRGGVNQSPIAPVAVVPVLRTSPATPESAVGKVSPPATVPTTTSETHVVARARGLSAGGGLTDLGDAQLEALLSDLEHIEAAPVAEPEMISGSRLVSGNVSGSED